jgi:biotin operon repressor
MGLPRDSRKYLEKQIQKVKQTGLPIQTVKQKERLKERRLPTDLQTVKRRHLVKHSLRD